jgi:nicotinate-nucleotide adenylyltransferase
VARDAPRIGIFGGTFDPIHNGHLQVAEEVRRALRLDRLLMVVANEPWQKQDRPVTPAEDRYAMVVAALADHPGLEASRMELDRGGPSFTVDTVRELLAEEPDAELFVVVGADVVGGLSSWREESALRELVILAVVDRPGAPAVVTPPGWRTVLVPVEPLDVSSTGLRTRLEQGGSVSGTVPESVIRCMAQRGLYATGR